MQTEENPDRVHTRAQNLISDATKRASWLAMSGEHFSLRKELEQDTLCIFGQDAKVQSCVFYPFWIHTF